jgi:hypothetical protein
LRFCCIAEEDNFVPLASDVANARSSVLLRPSPIVEEGDALSADGAHKENASTARVTNIGAFLFMG